MVIFHAVLHTVQLARTVRHIRLDFAVMPRWTSRRTILELRLAVLFALMRKEQALKETHAIVRYKKDIQIV